MASDLSPGLRRLARRLQPAAVRQLRASRRAQRLAHEKGLRFISRDLFYDLQREDRVLRIRKDHQFYLQHMIENFDYYVDSVIPLQTGDVRLVDMSGPRYHRLKGYGDIPFLFPSHTEPYYTTAEYLDFANLRGGETVLDLGAYSAVTSIVFAQLVGNTGRVYAFEADEKNQACSRVNLEMAAAVLGTRNISFIPKAVWSHSEGLLFSHEGAMGSSAVAITGGHRGLERVVPSIRLADFAAQTSLSKVDFVKIDIEGGEVEVLQDSATLLHNLGARLIVEPHFVAGTVSTARCCDLLEAAGYRVRVRPKSGESEPLIEALP
ncbi:MAG: FkbM family methyltransferase [Acidobacteriaceae bacterium]